MAPRISRLLLVPAISSLFAVAPGGVRAQVAEGLVDTTAVVADSSDLASVGRAAQALFERRRLYHLPVSLGSGSGGCDEHVGRFCTWYEEGEWYPTPEKPDIVELRAELSATLDSLQRHLPGDPWLLGQRVWYRSEGGHWGDALRIATACRTVEPWWCRALQGFALHGLGRYEESERVFEEALGLMGREQAEEWRFPERALDSKARDRLRDARAEGPDSASLMLGRLWTLADPLYLAAGNDRLTAHYARWTVATLRERARNPFRIRWGGDLEELTVRHGWEMGWERSPGLDFSVLDHVIGHKHPEGRDYMPPGDVLADPARATAEDLRPDRRRPSSLHAPDYAPVLLPMDGQIAVFPRGEEMVVVSSHFLPDDTTFHSGHGHELPWLEPRDQAGLPDRVGLFAVPLAGGHRRGTSRRGSAEGALMLTVPTASYVVSAEVWSPERRRAGRQRLGVVERPAPADVATLSDLLLLRPASTEPEVLESALDLVLPRAEILPGQSFAIAWEVVGLGFRDEILTFEVSVEKTGRNLFRRLGELIGVADRPQPLALSWEEPAPREPTHHFRYLNLDLPELDEGDYEIRLTLRTNERSEAVTTQAFQVRPRR